MACLEHLLCEDHRAGKGDAVNGTVKGGESRLPGNDFRVHMIYRDRGTDKCNFNVIPGTQILEGSSGEKIGFNQVETCENKKQAKQEKKQTKAHNAFSIMCKFHGSSHESKG